VRLEIEDRELIELLVTLKERLTRIEEKVDSLCNEVEEAEQCMQGNLYKEYVGYNTQGKPTRGEEVIEPLGLSENLTLGESMPTLERLGLYGAISVINPKDWEDFINPPWV
jgi:hypothetical protein